MSSDIDVALIPTKEIVCDTQCDIVVTPSPDDRYGHIWLKVSPDLASRLGANQKLSKLIKSHPEYPNSKWLSALDMKALLSEGLTAAASKMGIKITTKVHGPAIEVWFTKSENIAYEFTADFTCAVKCASWPPQSLSWWENRTRSWPSRETVLAAASCGCHVVPIGDESRAGGTLDWRYSFSEAEGMLADSFIDETREVYTISKSLVKKLNRFHFHNDSFLKSYHLKTMVFWYLEHRTINTLRGVENFLDFVVLSLETKDCPHYFLRGINLFQDMASSDNQKLTEHFTDLARAIRKSIA